MTPSRRRGHHTIHDERVSVSLSLPATRRLPAAFALLTATVLWGSTFLVTKNSLDALSVANLLAWRFGIASILLLVAGGARLRGLTAIDWRRGVVIGTFLAFGFLAQTTGLQHTSAAVSGFLTGLMVVLTPLFAATLFREKVTARGWAAVAVATVGLALVALQGWQLSPGALITLVGAAGFALQIASLSHWATAANSYALTAISVTVAALVCGGAATVAGTLEVPLGSSEWIPLLYLAFGATCLGLLLQAWSQSYLSASTAAVLMTMEPVFAAIIAVLVGGESAPTRVWVGGTLIVAAMLVSELGPRGGRDACCPRLEPT